MSPPQRIFAALHGAFHDREHPAWPWLQGTIWVLIVLSILLFLVEIAFFEGDEPALLIWADQILLWVFAVEISLRVVTYRPPETDLYILPPADRLRTLVLGRLRYAVEPLNLVDILTVLALHPALRGLRALRLLRLARSLPIFRYSNPLYGAVRAFGDNALLYAFAFSVLGSAAALGGLSIFLVERETNPAVSTVADGLWWAIVTLTTVGYGDISPTTALGRVVGGTLMVTGMFTLALFAGVVGHTLLNAVLSLQQEQFRMSASINHIVLCNYDAGARMLLDSLLEEVDPEAVDLVIFSPGPRPAGLPPEFRWVSGDPTKESELDKVRMREANAAIVVGPRAKQPQDADSRTILTLFTIRAYLSKDPKQAHRRRPLYLVAEVLDAENVAHARAAGADEVIETTRLGFSLLSHALVQRGTGDILGKITSAGAHSLYVGTVPEGVTLPGTFRAVADAVKRSTGAMVIGLHDAESGLDHLNPPADAPVARTSHLIYLAEQPVLPTA